VLGLAAGEVSDKCAGNPRQCCNSALICRQLALAEGTVKVHVSAVLRALGVRNRTQAVIAASRIGLRLPD
jgi:DNA-binding NarL/FixJ family response regulator